MTIPEQSAILPEAIVNGFLQPKDIIQWADMMIVALEKPPPWIIELSTLRSPPMIDCVSRLRKQASPPLTVRQQIQIIVLGQAAGLISLNQTLAYLFEVILDREERPLDALGERLVDALVEWDFQDDLDVIQPPLKAEFGALFREVLTDAEEIKAVLPWKFAKEV